MCVWLTFRRGASVWAKGRVQKRQHCAAEAGVCTTSINITNALTRQEASPRTHNLKRFFIADRVALQTVTLPIHRHETLTLGNSVHARHGA